MEIKKKLSLLIQGNYHDLDINPVVELCKSYAIAYLKMKQVSGAGFYSDESIESLAYNFISEIFRRDMDGRFINLENYFEGKPVESLEPHQLKTELRRLVFTKVNDGLFRHYGEQDPSLRKIIRNIKLALDSENLREVAAQSKNRLILKGFGDETLPGMPPDFLEIHLCSVINESTQIPEIVSETIQILKKQQLYRKEIPITQLAVSIRNSYVYVQQKRDKTSRDTFVTLLNGDLNNFIDRSTNLVQKKMKPKYIRNDKISSGEFEKYFSAASDIIRSQFTDPKEHKESQFDHLSGHLEKLDYEEYRKKHRPKLEYIVRLIRQDMTRRLRKDYLDIKHTG